MKHSLLLIWLCGYFLFCSAQSSEYTVISPDQKIEVTCNIGQAVYSISFTGVPVLVNSKLGLIRDDEDFSRNLKMVKASKQVKVKDSYQMLNAKKKNITYLANQRTFMTKTASDFR